MIFNSLNIYYQNVRGLNTNVTEVRQQINNSSYDIYIFTETWLNSSCFDRELFEGGFNVYRRDRETSASTKKRGGGVLIAVSNRLKSARITEYESDCEDIIMGLHIFNVKKRDPCCQSLCCISPTPPNNKYFESFFR